MLYPTMTSPWLVHFFPHSPFVILHPPLGEPKMNLRFFSLARQPVHEAWSLAWPQEECGNVSIRLWFINRLKSNPTPPMMSQVIHPGPEMLPRLLYS